MQLLPSGQRIVAELGFFFFFFFETPPSTPQIHLFVLWSHCIQSNLLAKSHRLMLQEGLEATD